MATTTFPLGFGRFDRLQFRDLDTKFVRAFDQVFPLKRARPLRSELVIKRHWIVIIQQYEMITDRQLEPGLNDQAVFD